nr:hypothetical protein CFP56_77751 [Quercus suber]
MLVEGCLHKSHSIFTNLIVCFFTRISTATAFFLEIFSLDRYSSSSMNQTTTGPLFKIAKADGGGFLLDESLSPIGFGGKKVMIQLLRCMTAKCTLSMLGYLISVSFNALYAWDQDPGSPLGILEMGYSDSSYPQVPPRSLPGLSCKMVVQDPFVGYIQVPRAFIRSHLESRISSALLGSRISQALLPGVKDLLGFVGIKDLPGFVSWSQGSPRLCWNRGCTQPCWNKGSPQLCWDQGSPRLCFLKSRISSALLESMVYSALLE